MTDVPGREGSSEIREYVSALWRQRWTLLACVIVIPVLALVASLSLPKSYESTAVIQISSSADPTLLGGQPSSAPAVAVTARLLTTPRFAAAAAGYMRPRARPGALGGSISVKTESDIGFIDITGSAGRPQAAAAIANAYASAALADRRRAAALQVQVSIAQLKDQLASAPRDSRAQVQADLSRLRALRAAGVGQTGLVQRATPNPSPVSPNPVRNTILAVVVGLILGISLAFLRDRLDQRLRHPSEVESLVRAPLLAVVPDEAFRTPPGSSPAVNEAFQTLLTSLTYFNVDTSVRSVVVTSAATGEGKTTVATNLAIAAARAGRSVVLIDADLRRPQVGTRLGLPATGGLVATLTGQQTLGEAMLVGQSETAGRLRVLAAGAVPPNPSELLSSDRMAKLLDQVQSESELVVIDSPPVLLVSDALPLIEAASGAVVVARIGQSRRDHMKRLRRTIDTMRGTVFGAVATGVGRRQGYGYGYEAYGYGYGSGGRRGRREAAQGVNGSQQTQPQTDGHLEPHASEK